MTKEILTNFLMAILETSAGLSDTQKVFVKITPTIIPRIRWLRKREWITSRPSTKIKNMWCVGLGKTALVHLKEYTQNLKQIAASRNQKELLKQLLKSVLSDVDIHRS